MTDVSPRGGRERLAISIQEELDLCLRMIFIGTYGHWSLRGSEDAWTIAMLTINKYEFCVRKIIEEA